MATFTAAIRSRRPTRCFAIGGSEVAVFDGLVDRATARLVYEHLRGAHYRWGIRDSNARRHYHAVRWYREVAPEAIELPFFSDVVKLVDDIARPPRLVLDRIYVNFNLHGEVHHAHADGTGVTALYCANIEWRPEWQGETLFYDGKEPTHAVLPRPGRLVIFDAALVHRGAPPARDCFEPRINLAFKFQRRRSASWRADRPIAVVRKRER